MMKTIINVTIMLMLSVLIVSRAAGQIRNDNDFVVVGEISSDQNMTQVQMRYADRVNVCFINEVNENALEQVALALEGKTFDNLHIFVRSTPTSLIFNNLVITTANIVDYKKSLLKWKNTITGKVIIHCTATLDKDISAEMKQTFENNTGLEFTLTK